MRKILMMILYIALFLVANILVGIFGPWITPLNALIIISADMVIRDRIQYETSFLYSVICSVLAGIATVLINPNAEMIAIASCSSIILSGLFSAVAFKLKSGDFYKKSYPANIVAAAVDSIAFPLIAFGSLMFGVTLAQFLAKVLGATVILYVLRKFYK